MDLIEYWVNMPVFIMSFNLLSSDQVCGYIDPGTGSIIIQVVIGALAGGIFAIKIFWKRISNWFKTVFSGAKKPDHVDN